MCTDDIRVSWINPAWYYKENAFENITGLELTVWLWHQHILATALLWRAPCKREIILDSRWTNKICHTNTEAEITHIRVMWTGSYCCSLCYQSYHWFICNCIISEPKIYTLGAQCGSCVCVRNDSSVWYMRQNLILPNATSSTSLLTLEQHCYQPIGFKVCNILV